MDQAYLFPGLTPKGRIAAGVYIEHRLAWKARMAQTGDFVIFRSWMA